jgi:hypothetical protein
MKRPSAMAGGIAHEISGARIVLGLARAWEFINSTSGPSSENQSMPGK